MYDTPTVFSKFEDSVLKAKIAAKFDPLQEDEAKAWIFGRPFLSFCVSSKGGFT